jgi:WD40 repeat protein
VAYSPDGKTIISSSTDGTLRVWSLDKGQELLRLESTSGGINSVVFNPKDASQALSAASDGTIALWNIDTPSNLVVFTQEHRYVPELSCDQRARYQIEPLCAASATP